MSSRRLVSALAIAILVGLVPAQVYAHGFGERYDLPVPLNYFLVGAAATVALSFVVIGFFVRQRPGSFDYPRYNLLGSRWLGGFLTGWPLLGLIRVVSVAVFALVVVAALFGTNKPIDNLSPTFVWIIWWVGMAYLSALLGNLWMLVNPWKITFEWAERLIGAQPGGAGMFRYPERWDTWPALVLFLAFAWVENVYSGAATPANLGLLIVTYSVVTWGGMLAFGKHRWLRYGEAFSVLFGFYARFSPTEVRVPDSRMCKTCDLECDPSGETCVDCYECFERAGSEGHRREVNLRPYAVGLANPGRVSTATAFFVVLALATVTFDGLTATPLWARLQRAILSAADTFGSNTGEVLDTFGLVLLPVAFLVVYAAFSWSIRQLSGEKASVNQVLRGFVFSLVPIALAYNLAHFLSLLAIQGQAIIPLASDPLGLGWDLFGTIDYRINIGIVNAKFVWFMSVAAIVLGHIIAVYIAHVISLRRTPDRSSALRGQYPMLVLMVFYTATSLWIIAQPIVG